MFDKRLHRPRTDWLLFGTVLLLTILLLLLALPQYERVQEWQGTPTATATAWAATTLVPTATVTPPATAGWWGDTAATFVAATPLFSETPKP